MAELKLKWNGNKVRRAFAAFLSVCICAVMIYVTPLQLFADNLMKAATSGNGTSISTNTAVTTSGNGASTNTNTAVTTSGNGTDTNTTTAATAGNSTKAVKIASITLSKTSYTYNGKAKTPAVTVKDSKGNVIDPANYTIKYSNNKKVGKATVKVTAKGSVCTGSKSATFKINPTKTSITKITATSKGFKVTWKKVTTETTGYQIRYSTTNKFTASKTDSIKLSKNTTTSKSCVGLSGGKKYYVQVRTYKTVSGTTYYSSWSDSVIVTTKR